MNCINGRKIEIINETTTDITFKFVGENTHRTTNKNMLDVQAPIPNNAQFISYNDSRRNLIVSGIRLFLILGVIGLFGCLVSISF